MGQPELSPAEREDRRQLIFGLLTLACLPLISCTSYLPTSPGQETNLPATAQSPLSPIQSGTGTKATGERNTDELIVPRDCLLSQLLDRVCPGWQRWQGVPNVNGDGIWSIPELIENGLCNIYVNGVMVTGSNINVDTIQLQRRDVLAIRPV